MVRRRDRLHAVPECSPVTASVTPSASAVYQWARDHSSPSGRVNWCWTAVEAATGLDSAQIMNACAELRSAGLTRLHDHGPNTYGHTSTYLV